MQKLDFCNKITIKILILIREAFNKNQLEKLEAAKAA